MLPVLTAAQMRACEQSCFESGVRSIDIMENAARALAALINRLKLDTCVFACGAGGNGGDGYAAARLFAQSGGRAVILKVAEPRTEDAIRNAARAEEYVFAVTDISALDTLPRPDAWIDCVFGIGLNREVSGDAKKAIDRMNADRARGSRLISCDIPSGLNADTGEIMGACVKADYTLCLHALKSGLLLSEGKEMCGAIEIAAIGIDAKFMPEDCALLMEKADAVKALPYRRQNAHKNDFGHLLIVAGSRGMAGAACMCALGALRTGAGLVTVACPESIMPIVQITAPSAMCLPLPEENGAISDAALPILSKALAGKTALAVGPGLSRACSEKVIALMLESGMNAVFDADALNIISQNPELIGKINAHHALTPHPGEARRLTGLDMDAESQLKALVSLGCAALVKGATTVISDGKQLVYSRSGCVGMAKGGSGDVLTGMAGALLAQGLDPLRALTAASELHGLAGEEAEKRLGSVSMLPTDIINCICEVTRADA